MEQPTASSEERGIKRSVTLPVELQSFIEERAVALRVSEAWVIRDALFRERDRVQREGEQDG